MATTVAALQAVLSANDRDFKRDLDRAEGHFHKFGSAIKVGALAAGAAIGVGLGITAKVGWSEFAQGAKVAAQTNAVLKSTGQIANVTSKQVDALGKSLMEKSGIDDEVIKSGENMLLTFKNIRNEAGAGNDIFTQSTEILTDMSVALGTDMSKSAIQLGKALNDPIRGITALTRVGVTFTDAQRETITSLVETGHTMQAQKIILRELNSEFGGSAEAAGKTLPGQLAILRETFTNLAGDLVGRFIPVVQSVASNLTDLLGFIDRLRGAKNATVGLKIAFSGIKGAVNGLLKALRTMLLGSAGTLKPLKLPSGKILEFERVGASSGLVASLREVMDSLPWTDIGHRIGAAIGDAVQVSADWLTTAFTAANSWIDSHSDQIAQTGAKIFVTVISTLLDPAFWIKNWKLGLAIAIAVIPAGAVARISVRLVSLLLRPFARFFGPRLFGIILRSIQAIVDPFSRLPKRLRDFFEKAGRGIIEVFDHLVKWLREKFFGWLDKQTGLVATILKKAFKVGFIITAFNLVKDAVQGAIDKIRSMAQWFKNTVDNVKDLVSWIGKIHVPHFPGPGGVLGDGIVGAVGGSGPRSISSTLWDDLALANSEGLIMTSGYRPGAITSTGNTSLHSVYPSKAIDVAGSEGAMRTFFLQEVARGAVTGLREVIHSPYWWHPGAGITRIPASAGSVLRDHYSHVHVGSYGGGGVVPGPRGAQRIATVHGGETILPTHLSLQAQLRAFMSDRLWPVFSRLFGWTSRFGMPRGFVGSMNTAMGRDQLMLTRDTVLDLLGSGPRGRGARGAGLQTLVHELAHVFQKSSVLNAHSRYDLPGGFFGIREGLAEAFSNRWTAPLAAALGWPGSMGGMSSHGNNNWYSRMAYRAWKAFGWRGVRYGQFKGSGHDLDFQSFDRGGYLRPGLTLAYNGTRRPEPVGGGTTYNFNGAILDGQKLLRFIQEEQQRYGKRNGG